MHNNHLRQSRRAVFPRIPPPTTDTAHLGQHARRCPVGRLEDGPKTSTYSAGISPTAGARSRPKGESLGRQRQTEGYRTDRKRGARCELIVTFSLSGETSRSGALNRQLQPAPQQRSTPGSSANSLVAQHGFQGASSPRRDREPVGTSSNGQPRRVGLLGIPLSDSEDDDVDGVEHSVLSSESLEANPPVSPVIAPAPAQPAPTYSRGGSTRSGPSTRGERHSEAAAFVSEQNFRDIVSRRVCSDALHN